MCNALGEPDPKCQKRNRAHNAITRLYTALRYEKMERRQVESATWPILVAYALTSCRMSTEGA